MSTPDLTPLVMVPIIGVIMYRRIRRQFGRQSLAPKPIKVRLVLLGLVLALLIAQAFMQPVLLLPIAGGLFGGVAVAVVNLRLTRFEWAPAGDAYYPHPYVGAVLTLLLVGRLAYRVSMFSDMTGGGAPPPPDAFQNPLTVGLVALLIGYYFAYAAGLLIEIRRHHRRDA